MAREPEGEEKVGTIKGFVVALVVAVLVGTIISITATNNSLVNNLTRLMDQNVQLQQDLKSSQGEVKRLERELQAYKELVGKETTYAYAASTQLDETRKQLYETSEKLRKAQNDLGSEKTARQFQSFELMRQEKKIDEAYQFIAGVANEDLRRQVGDEVFYAVREARKVTPWSVSWASAQFKANMDRLEKIAQTEGRYYGMPNMEATYPQLEHLLRAYELGMYAESDARGAIERLEKYAGASKRTDLIDAVRKTKSEYF